ncbi:hypothetical protein B0T22DRAFT_478391 [Podospora appendiculata]|uniref:Heterokaryon incompatibility domain-containing protein n=1 Tax=Podospora appendiculata TaxID=314037 RepID=A0AAE0XLN7_9PEZI|nr:hypothetical protein B0T22DRAFT_478391 [Podospora appendiculata]
MRLLNAASRKLEEYPDLEPGSVLPPNVKIDSCCTTALKRNIRYLWADTICIDKSNGMELAEAVNSMYAWYRDAVECYVYMSDVHPMIASPGLDGLLEPEEEWEEEYPAFRDSRWFTRGWTLQELLAPRVVRFYDSAWNYLGQKSHSSLLNIDAFFLATLSDVTGIPPARHTTRVEDQAYALLGLFDVNMPLLYGEREKAFLRLQEEIIKRSTDESIFAWGYPGHLVPNRPGAGLLATRPADLRAATSSLTITPPDDAHHCSITNLRILFHKPLLVTKFGRDVCLVGLKCRVHIPNSDPRSRHTRILALVVHRHKTLNIYRRLHGPIELPLAAYVNLPDDVFPPLMPQTKFHHIIRPTRPFPSKYPGDPEHAVAATIQLRTMHPSTMDVINADPHTIILMDPSNNRNPRIAPTAAPWEPPILYLCFTGFMGTFVEPGPGPGEVMGAVPGPVGKVKEEVAPQLQGSRKRDGLSFRGLLALHGGGGSKGSN